MKITYIFTATGKYARFIPGLVESGIKNFLPEHDTTFITFTDSVDYINEKLQVYNTKKRGWPYDTLYRFHLINQIADKINTDFIFYGNANMIFHDKIGEEILPIQDFEMVGALHPCFYNALKQSFPLERNVNSTAYVPYGEESNYYQGCFFGGKKESFLKMTKILQENIDKDVSNNIIAVWYDESHLNRYFIDNPPMQLHPGYIYPENMQIPFDKKIVQLDKSNYGGHHFLRM